MSVTEPALLSLTEVADAIATKKISSREATQSCLDRAVKSQPSLNAYMSIEADAALTAADAADAALARGKAAAYCTACRWHIRTCITTRDTS